MDPLETMASLFEANEQNRIYFYKEFTKTGIRNSAAKFNFSKSARPFDFDLSFEHDSPLWNKFDGLQSVIEHMQTDGLQRIRRGTFILPFPECFYMFNVTSPVNGVFTNYICYCEETSDKEISINTFKFIKNLDYFIWQVVPINLKLCPSTDSGKTLKPVAFPGLKLPQKILDDFRKEVAFVSGYILAGTAFLSNARMTTKSEVIEVREPTDSADRKNYYKDLPSIIKINLNTPIYEPQPPFGKRKTPRGSDVRSHARHMKGSGKVIRVKAHQRNGGRQSPAGYIITDK